MVGYIGRYGQGLLRRQGTRNEGFERLLASASDREVLQESIAFELIVINEISKAYKMDENCRCW
jgi:hypothetical protein